MKRILLFILISMLYLLAGYQWGVPIVIHSHPTAQIKEQNMCIDKNGTIHVVWNERYTSTYSQIFYSHSQDGGDNWSIPFNVSQSDTSLLRDPAIASDNNGKLYVAYDWNSSYPILMLKTFDGTTWSEPVRIDSNSFYFKSKFIVDNDDRVYHFWKQFTASYYRYIDITDSVWTQKDSSITDFFFIDIDVDSDNNLHATGSKYFDPLGLGFSAYVSYSKHDSKWSEISIIDSMITNNNSVGMRICISNENCLHVASKEQENLNAWRTFYQFKLANDSIWSEPEMVSDMIYPSIFDIVTDSQDKVHIFQQYLQTTESIDEFIKYDSTWTMDSYSFGEIGAGSPIIIEANNLLNLCFGNSSYAGFDQLFFNKGMYVGIEEDQSNIVEDYKLYQNYPNPFNNQTNISYTLKNINGIEINVFNTKGQFVQNLVSERQGKGLHSVLFDADKLNSGIYYYRLKIDGVVKETKKMLYLR
ncbi:MAG: T9SS type A sorting domain-containing protein [Candidatus Delongbacteria bacterium]|nr:T9SS type A sorting domain-containing protein [Candidatus Delongbacteria bacterium]